MPSRAVVWTLSILAAVLIVIPLLGMLGMMAWGGGMMGASGMTGGGNMMGMHAVGITWMLGAAAVVIALIVLVVRGVTRV